MRIAITGSNGFIGRRLVSAAVGAGHEVLCLARRSSAEPNTLYRHFDLSCHEGFDAALEGADAVIHAAAHIPASYDDPGEARLCLELNALGTLELLQACGRRGVSRVALLSGNVYRGGTNPVSEDAPVDPSGRATFYLASKACADMFTRQVSRTLPLETVTLRPASVYGPGLMRGMLATFAVRLQRGQPVQIADAGRYRTDFVHVDDVASATLAATTSDVQGTYNLGTGVLTSTLEIARQLASLLGASACLLDVSPIDDRSPENFSPLDSTRARRDLGWRPRPLESGLREYVEALRATSP